MHLGPSARVLLITAAVVLLAATIPTHPSVALGIAVVVLVFSVALSAPSLLLAIVFGSTFAAWRVGAASLNMSVCDAATVMALIAALPYVPWKSRPLRAVLVGLVFYLALISISLAANATDRAIAEWFHRAVLVGGAVLIGAAVAHRRETAIALRSFCLASAVVAVGAIYTSLTTGLAPAFPFGMHKNAAGSGLAIAVIVLVVAPGQLAVRAPTIRFLRVLVIAGLVATQSRGATLALVAALAIYMLRHGRSRQRAPILFLIISMGLIVASVVTLQDELQFNPKFNAIDTRTDAFDIAINDVWLPRPLVGGGLRWFQEANGANAGIHNEVIAELSEVGLIGLFGFIVLMGSILRSLMRRRRSPIGEIALLVFIFLLLFGLTEILWVAGTITLTMLIVGLAVGEDEPVALATDRDTTAQATA